MLQKPVITFDGTEFSSGVSYSVSTGFKSHLTSDLKISVELAYNHYCTGVYIFAGSPGGSTEYEYDLNLGYIALSLLPEYNFGNKRRIFVNAGPYCSILTSSVIKGTAGGKSVVSPWTSSDFKRNLNEDLRHMGFGLLVSAGLRLGIKETFNFMPQLRYDFGIVAIEKPYDPYGGKVISACFQGRKMRALSLIVEFDFRISKKKGG
jgi:hypothetical protein